MLSENGVLPWEWLLWTAKELYLYQTTQSPIIKTA